jgi:hypothetical protein
MSDRYTPTTPPTEYDPSWLSQELWRLAGSLAELQLDKILFTIVHVAPARPREGLVVNADGTNWNPGTGAGLYQYLSAAWVKL